MWTCWIYRKGKCLKHPHRRTKKLEYRGYDSVGIAVYHQGKVDIRKYKGRLNVLERHIREVPVHGTMGIGHTDGQPMGHPRISIPIPIVMHLGRSFWYTMGSLKTI